MRAMRIVITGASGQLGSSLQETAPDGIRLIPTDVRELDLGDRDALLAGLARHRPDIIINSAAYTAVDKAESHPDVAARVNTDAVADIAGYCIEANCRLVQISTDFVFNGKYARPMKPDDATAPANVYGRTKLAGEQAAAAAGDLARVVRTSWAYSEHGHNFVKTMLRLASSHDSVSVVDDQVGSPTYARNLATALWRLVERWPEQRALHFSDSGACSWHEFATTIFADALTAGLITRAPEVRPVSSADYGAPAVRPAYSVLDTADTCAALGITPMPWREALREMLSRLPG